MTVLTGSLCLLRKTVGLGAKWKQAECGYTLKLKPVRFPKRWDLGWERGEVAGVTPVFWKDGHAVPELGGCKRSLPWEGH